jgi:hypothetical protein
MSMMIRADDGDELSISAYALSDQQGIVRIELDNRCHSEDPGFDWITLSIAQARDLAHALLAAAGSAEGSYPPTAQLQALPQ